MANISSKEEDFLFLSNFLISSRGLHVSFAFLSLSSFSLSLIYNADMLFNIFKTFIDTKGY
jgi:hypothetical protein